MSAIRFNYYDDWRNSILTCPVCGWQGRWEQADINHYSELMDAECPKCDSHPPMLAIVSYATGAETKQAAKEGNPEAVKELGRVLQRERRLVTLRGSWKGWRQTKGLKEPRFDKQR